MSGFIAEASRSQTTLFPESLDDYIDADNPVRVIDVFVNELDLQSLGFERTDHAQTGRPGYLPSTLLKLYIYGYLNRIQSSRRLERESRRNLELILLIGRFSPDFKTIADFRRDNGPAIKKVCAQLVVICKNIGMFNNSALVIDGSKFKAVNSKDNNYTVAKLKARIQQTEERVSRYLEELEFADRQPAKYRRIARWKKEHILDEMERRLDAKPEASRIRRQTVEHPFGTIKSWMGATHFLTKTMKNVATEMSLHILAYNLKRLITIFRVTKPQDIVRA